MMRWLLPALLCASLLGCGGGGVPASPRLLTADCSPLTATDHSASSLPRQLTPRPGPALLYAPPPRAPQLENTGVWEAPPILISGASAYRCGEFIYQDWIYDDRGAAGLPDPTDPHDPTGYLFSPRAGTVTYPSDPATASNAADLVELRIRPLADATAFRFTLNSLLDPSLLGISLALGESATPNEWPHGAGVSSPAQLFATIHGNSVSLHNARGQPLQANASVSIDFERRQIELRIPHTLLNPGQATLRVAAGTGLWDAGSDQYRQPGLIANETNPGGASQGGAALFNLAFRSSEPLPEFGPFEGRSIVDAAIFGRLQGRWWRERAQADALRSGDASRFFAEVDFGKLARRENDESGVPQSGHMNRIFASRFAFGQGVDYASECGGVSPARPCDGALIGQLQPYAVYIPTQPQPATGYGLTLLLHALSANYNQYLGSRHAAQFGERGPGSIVVTPAGRGPDGYYSEVAEADVFEVWADIARHYRLDPDWTAMSGVSMGGFGSFRLAVRYPDLFARIMPIVAAAREPEQLGSLLHVPVMMWTAALDELQPVVSTQQTVNELDAAGLRYESWLFPTWDHLSPSTYDFYAPGAEFLGEARVLRNPSTIRYVLAPEEDEARVGMIADKAYWLSDLRLREPGSGQIAAHSEGFGLRGPDPVDAVRSFGVLSGGYHEPAPYQRHVREWAPPTAQPVRNRLIIEASNIASVTIHPQRARLSCGAELDIVSDGEMVVNFAGC